MLRWILIEKPNTLRDLVSGEGTNSERFVNIKEMYVNTKERYSDESFKSAEGTHFVGSC